MSDICLKNSLNAEEKGGYSSEKGKEIDQGAPKSFWLRGMAPLSVKASDNRELSMIQGSLIVKGPDKTGKISLAKGR